MDEVCGFVDVHLVFLDRSPFSRCYHEFIHEGGISAGRNFSRGDEEDSAMDRRKNMSKPTKYKTTMY